ncbi:hypothetical protein [Streptomyces sp. CAU 1734]|uniref:hypothetical protein n=1 Tax=Streptomyces sp. CAU 1734 TaxID=3140360 RepID=UPI0032602D72
MTGLPLCPGCRTRTRRPGAYLCSPCWGALSPAARGRLSERGPRALARLRALHAALVDGVALGQIRIRP